MRIFHSCSHQSCSLSGLLELTLIWCSLGWIFPSSMLVKYCCFVKFKLISLGASDDQKHVTQVVVCLCGRLSYLTGTHLWTTGMGTHISVFMMYVFIFEPVCLSVELPAYLSLSVFAIIIYKSIHHYQYMPSQLAWMVILFHSSQSPTECVSLCVETFPLSVWKAGYWHAVFLHLSFHKYFQM